MFKSWLQELKNNFALDKKWAPALRGVTSDGAATIVVTVANLIAIPLYINYLGVDQYGVWITIFSLVGVIALFEIGVDQYVVASLSTESGDLTVATKMVISKVLLIKIYTSLLYILGGIFLYNYYRLFISVGVDMTQSMQLIVVVLVSFYVVNLYINLYNSLLISKQKFQFINIVTAVFSVLAIILALGMLNLGYGIESIPIGLFSASFLQLLIYINYFKDTLNLSSTKVVFFKKIDKELINYSTSFQVLKIAYYYRNQLINLVINNVIGSYAVTIYSVVTRLSTMTATIINKMIGPLFPQLTIEISKNTANKLFIRLNILIVRITIIFATLIYFINPIFINFWVGSGYEVSRSYLASYLIYYIIIQSMSIYGMVIYSTKKFEKWPFYAVIEVGTSLILAIFLGNLYGIVGIISALVISSLFIQIYLFYIVLNQLEINKYYFINEIWKKALIPNIISFISLFIYIKLNNDINILNVILIVFFTNIAYEYFKKVLNDI